MNQQIFPLWLDLASVGVGAFQGALFAIVKKRFDLVGVIAMAILTGLGGGIVRDLLLGVGRPSGMQDKYLLTALAAVIAALIYGKYVKENTKVVTVLDSIATALFAIAGTYKAILFGSSALVAVMLGIITAVGGGVLRDVVSRNTPQIFTGGPLYATGTAIGSSLFVALNETAINSDTTVVICVAAIVVIHMVSIRFRLYLKPALSNLDQPEKGE
jgi:uncharacterized membrane protein YeiH